MNKRILSAGIVNELLEKEFGDDTWEECPTELGRDKFHPYTHAPDDWHETGVPYGAWCECSNCGVVERSTFIFDYYADAPGELLHCESCRGF